MLYPKNFEEKIGFEKIREIIKKNCLCELGHEYVDKMRFSSNHNMIVKWVNQVDELKEILMLGEPFPNDNYYNLLPVLDRLSIEGTFIEPEGLFNLKSSLQTILDCQIFIEKKEQESFPELHEIATRIDFDKSILNQIELIIDDKGKIRDSASVKLKEIRRSIIQQHKTIGIRLNSILKDAKKNGWIAGDTELTIREGRSVIPISATNKRKIKGFIHDESATGQTVYLEPAEVLDANNQIRELENAERREIIRILLEFSNYLRPNIEDLRCCYKYLGIIDFIRAKAKFAINIEAYKPIINDKQVFNWLKAKHPLLLLSFMKIDKKVVPLEISLDSINRILVISGPNAGGKSVCMKTVALLQYMVQCGVLVPMESYSEMGVFENMFIDIGDEQSLEDDLSTYSSHLLNMKNFVKNADSKSIFFIDEMGTGTEPSMGGALAEAVLGQLNIRKCYGVVTTHYSNLKVLADRDEGIANGAMLYDSKEMKPLYKLKIGKPGSSFAFEIAKNIGLQKNIINQAINLAGRKQVRFDRQLQDLEVEKDELQKRLQEFEIADGFLQETIEKYNKLKDDLEKSRKDVLNQAKREAKAILSESNKLIENTIREIKESNAEKERTQKARIELEKQKEKIEAQIKKEEKKTLRSKSHPSKIKIDLNTPIVVGDAVLLKGQKEIGEVLEIKGKDAFVIFGSLKMKLKLIDLQKTEKPNSTSKSKIKFDFDLNKKAENFELKLDLRGRKAEEAINILENYIDEAILIGIKEVKILHGKGDGILRHIIRQCLNNMKDVKSAKDEHVEFGGQGITVVVL